MNSRDRIYTHPSQLKDLSVIPFLRTSGLGTLRLRGRIVEHPESKRWESDLNRYYYACGCDTSARSMIIGLFIGSAWAGYSYFQGTLGAGIAVGTALSVAIGAAIVGKLIGLFRANGKLKETIKEIQAVWPQEERLESEPWTCG